MENKRAWTRVDLNAVSSNINIVRQRIGAGVKLMAVVKADGYGHGAVMVAKKALEAGANCIGVAICEEAVSLRESGVSEPILILGYTPEEMFAEAIQRGITLTVFDYETAVKISGVAAGLGKKAVIHIKLETGLNRLGFDSRDESIISSIEAIERIVRDPWIYTEGIFTHFSMADIPDLSFTPTCKKCSDSFAQTKPTVANESVKVNACQYTYEQARIFNNFIGILESRGVYIPVKHTANSAATLQSSDFFYDMVRIGIILYGLRPSEGIGLCGYEFRPALSFMSRMSHVKKIKIGERVGYGGTFQASRETTVATVPVGYADGYTRALGNRAYVLVRGCRVPVIGTVCMDQLMIDITDVNSVSDIKQGELVTLIGRDCGAEITADDVAGWRGSINYEVVAGISKRVPRFYY